MIPPLNANARVLTADDLPGGTQIRVIDTGVEGMSRHTKGAEVIEVLSNTVLVRHNMGEHNPEPHRDPDQQTYFDITTREVVDPFEWERSYWFELASEDMYSTRYPR